MDKASAGGEAWASCLEDRDERKVDLGVDQQEGNVLQEKSIVRHVLSTKAIRFHLPWGPATAGDRKGPVGDMKICGGDNGRG